MGVGGCVRAALEDGSVEDEDADQPEEAIDTPDDERWPDVGAAEVAVRMTRSRFKERERSAYLNSWVWK